MSFEIYGDADANLSLIREKKVAVIGYGSQGHAHALNLRNSEVEVVVGLKAGSPSREKASRAGLTVMDVREACRLADHVMMLVPDEVMAAAYERDVAPELTPGKSLGFAHGFNIHFQKIVPPSGIDVFMVAPKGPGHTVRREFSKGRGVPCLVAIAQDASGKALELALSYAKALGGTKAGVFKTSFREETETDLFGEQAVLCGGLSQLIKAGYETLVEAGYSPAMAYFECLHEVKLITDLIYEGGLSTMRYSISNTAEFGDYTSGPKVIDGETKTRMRAVLKSIQSGEFADQWLSEMQAGGRNFHEARERERRHPLEEVGREIRACFNFPKDSRLVEDQNN